mgnify:CR=1 FL=1
MESPVSNIKGHHRLSNTFPSFLNYYKPLKKIAMTGEVTLRGHVLAIGGLKEKLMSSLRFGIKEAIIPLENENDYNELDEEIKKQLQVHLVSSYNEVARIHELNTRSEHVE